MGFDRNRTLKIDRGLYLLEQRGGRTYAARAWIDGGWKYTNLETTDYHAAEQSAVKWHRGLRSGREGHETIAQAATAFLESVPTAGKRKDHSDKWEAVREFWNPGMGRPAVAITAVDTPKLLEFVKWRQARSTLGRSQNKRITAHTLHKDLVTLRQILKHAVDRGVLASVPKFPGVTTVGSIDANPQPWLTPDEYKRLLFVANERIVTASNLRTRHQREELLAFIQFMHGTCLRVNEARNLRVGDCTIKERQDIEELTRGATHGEVQALLADNYYLSISVRISKTGPRTTHSRPSAVPAFRSAAKDKKRTDALFSEHHRDAFRELLIAANLRTNPFGHPRNAKCLRPSAISHWLIDRPTIPLSWLAANVGTSIQMLNDFYLRRLGVQLDGMAWL